MTLSQADHGTAGASLEEVRERVTAQAQTWAPWQCALAKRPHPIFSVPDHPPCQGYWRGTQYKGGPRVPVVIWYENGSMCSIVGEQYAKDDNERYDTVWKMSHFLQPVSRDDFVFWKKNKRWPDESEAVANTTTYGPVRTTDVEPAPAGIGHNRPPEGSFELFKGTIEELVREAEGLIKGGGAKDKIAADRAADLADKLSKIFNTKPAVHAANDPDITQEMRETVETYKGLTGRWVTVHKTAEIYKRIKDVVIAPFLKKLREEQRAAQQADQFGVPSEAPKPATAGGRPGTRSTGLREVKTAAIHDYAATLAHFAQNERVRLLIQDLADASVKVGTVPPGCEVLHDYKAV